MIDYKDELPDLTIEHLYFQPDIFNRYETGVDDDRWYYFKIRYTGDINDILDRYSELIVELPKKNERFLYDGVEYRSVETPAMTTNINNEHVDFSFRARSLISIVQED